MVESTANGSVPEHELRQRLPQQPAQSQRAPSPDTAKKTVMDLNAAEGNTGKDEKDRKTYGRTPDGTVFTVPYTHDMVSQLFSPAEPKNLSDIIIVGILSVKVLAAFMLPTSLSIPLFAVLFLFWRAMYNAGIGYVLQEQSNFNSVVAWAKNTGIFEKPASGKNQFPQYYSLLKREMETKIPKDYKFDEAPVEYNAWLLFRRGVDLILMSDFVSYVCFAYVCGGRPPGESLAMTAARWLGGILLVLFNLWVKLDAHRVVKDYAWYWGDFFFLIDQELTFDGVFEMAPHPMYSVGYAGFYGISLMAASYKVLFISIVGHVAQFVFLALVENPHIEKTYNPPPPRKRQSDSSPPAFDKPDATLEFSTDSLLSPLDPPGAQISYVRDILGVSNIDLHRTIDNSALLLQFYLYAFAFLTPSTPLFQTLFVVHAVAWRLWYSLGIGYILDRQSRKRNWTRHFIKHGEGNEEAWRQWKGIYHISMTMCYVSFAAAAYKMYSLPPDWEYGLVLLRHVIGLSLVALQMWTAVSIYESLGEFGWFFGDFFFFDQAPKLTYSGIYRFLNNPERVIGLAGVWGLALVTWSKAIFFLAFLSHALTLCFIQFVEQPHMQKRYGQRLRQESGVSKTFNRSLPSTARKWQSNVDKRIEECTDYVEAQIDAIRPKIFALIEQTVARVQSVMRTYPARVGVTRLAPNISPVDRKDYSVKIEGSQVAASKSANEKSSGRESEIAQGALAKVQQHQPLMLEYGAPIKVKWTAPLNHSKKDWVGLYMLVDNTSKEITRISSQGRWVATTAGGFESARAEQGILVSDKQTIEWSNDRGQPLATGEMEFAGDKLWWTTGVFEFRYHHDGKHNVMAVSEPFEVRISRFAEEDVELDGSGTIRESVESTLLPLVRNCFDRDPEIAPSTVDEAFGSLVEREGKFAKRVVYAVWQMFGIEFAPAVVKADGNVRNLAWRITHAKQVLAPYSLTPSRGTTTPSGTGAGLAGVSALSATPFNTSLPVEDRGAAQEDHDKQELEKWDFPTRKYGAEQAAAPSTLKLLTVGPWGRGSFTRLHLRSSRRWRYMCGAPYLEPCRACPTPQPAKPAETAPGDSNWTRALRQVKRAMRPHLLLLLLPTPAGFVRPVTSRLVAGDTVDPDPTLDIPGTRAFGGSIVMPISLLPAASDEPPTCLLPAFHCARGAKASHDICLLPVLVWPHWLVDGGRVHRPPATLPLPFDMGSAALSRHSLLRISSTMKVSLALLGVTGASFVAADAGSFKQNAEAALNQLQSWYNPTAGLWDTTGWWNAANCLTALLDLAAMDSNVKNSHLSIISNTYNNAPRYNPSRYTAQSNVQANAPPNVQSNLQSTKSNTESQTPLQFPNDHSLTQAMAWNVTQPLASLGLTKRASSGFLNDYYDDEGWWALAWVNAYDVTGNAQYLREAEAIFADMAASWPTPCANGGIWWDRRRTYISTISNELFFHLAAALATRSSGSTRTNYTNWANAIWAWFRASGLINAQGTLNDGLASNCRNNAGTVWSYNQGQILGALVEMHALSRDASLIAAATRIADAAIAQLAPQGILHDVCEPNCGGDGTQFKGVFLRNLRLLQMASPQLRWYKFIQANARSVWANDMRVVNGGSQIGVNWAKWVGTPDAATQSSGLDALNAALFTL
ncbi:hypothetical protein FH972_026080 [Carpinus fangiana]|uniref:Phosphatidylethanolamine N-methyltransferase n=1 Tax=Carpinus fangiana TaxID=176857 RepID=A0A5N6L3W1_9ROSI|nr:hypothetical protein FH972_026080 [Carpinus fangiana]